MPFHHKPVFTAIAATSLLLFAGCRVGPKYRPPTAPAPVAPNYKESTVNFQDAEGWKVASPQDAALRGKWWEIFNDSDLNALEEELNINNQNIKEYFQNFMEARALVAEARSQYWPTVTASSSWSRSQTSSNLTNSTFANTGRISTLMSFPIDVSWVPDFWGKIRNQVREYQYGAQVSAADLEVERLTEQASLAQYYFEIRGQDALQKILNDAVVADQKALDLTQGLYDTGIDDYISVVQARTTLQSVQAAAINLGVARAQYEHAIAVLLGKLATDFSLPVKPILTAPPPIPVGVPAQLLERRPDVAAAERTLAEANAIIGIGYGAFFPNVTLSASGGFESSSFQSWFSWPSRFWSIGPLISQTIFNGGLYPAELHQYIATYNADLAAYRQSVLTAFQQVEDYLAAVRIYSQEIQREQDAVESAEEYLNMEMVRYETGVDPYLYVITAQTTVLSDQETLATLQIEQMVAAVDLIEALGGAGIARNSPLLRKSQRNPPLGTTSCSTSGVAVSERPPGRKGARRGPNRYSTPRTRRFPNCKDRSDWKRMRSVFSRFWVAVRRFWSGWQQSLVAVTPKTVVRRHRAERYAAPRSSLAICVKLVYKKADLKGLKLDLCKAESTTDS